MKIPSTKLLILVVILAILSFSCSSNEQRGESSVRIKIIPQPAMVKSLHGSFKLTSGSQIVIISEDEKMHASAQFLKDALSEQCGIDVEISDSPSGHRNILLTDHDRDISLGEEGYVLKVEKDRVEMNGSARGVFYAIQSFLQLLPVNVEPGNTISIPACNVKDQPAFPWRGMHLDVSRHFFGPEVIKSYLDLMAMYKLNVFHWHLTDDQGWRIEIDKYPRLTEIGAWREGSGTQPWSYFINGAVEGKPKYGGYYSKEEIRDIVAYANERGITIVPEIEMPGHSWAALLAYPELSCKGVPWKMPDNVPFEFSDPFCAGNEKTFEFFENVLDEVIDLFPSEYIHIGGDECKKTPWEHCEKCRLRMKTEHLENVEELQSYFIKRIEAIVKAKGRRIIGWDEILEGGLAPDAAVMSWRGEEGGIEAASQGHKVVMTPGSYLYFNRSQFNKGKSGNALTLDRVYGYEPVPAKLKDAESELIMGAQACLWSENLYSEEIMFNQLMPRLTALAEMTWTPDPDKNWESFLNRLETHLLRFDKMGIPYAIPLPGGLSNEIFIGDTFTVELNKLYTSSEIHYTLDGAEPTLSSPVYNKALMLTDNATLKAKIFMPSGRGGETETGTYKKVALNPALTTPELSEGIGLTIFKGEINTLNDFSKLMPVSKVVVSEINIPEKVPDDFFGLQFDAYIDVPADGVYTFYISSDDGSQLFLDGKLLINNDGVHGMQFVSEKVALSGGMHLFKILFFENRYGEGLEVEMEGPGIKRERIPGTLMYHIK